jgi:hypothetical protein
VYYSDDNANVVLASAPISMIKIDEKVTHYKTIGMIAADIIQATRVIKYVKLIIKCSKYVTTGSLLICFTND